MTATQLFIVLFFLLGFLAVKIWRDNAGKPPPGVPEFTPEIPTIPKKVRPKLQGTVKDRIAMAQRRAHAREVHAHDQKVRV